MATFQDIRNHCEVTDNIILHREVALAYLDLLEAVTGKDLATLDADTVWFERTFPPRLYPSPDNEEIFASFRVYQLWRTAMLRMLVAFGNGASGDPFRDLRTLGKAAGVQGLTDLRVPLQAAFGLEVHPRDITRERALAAYPKIDASLRARFCDCCRKLDTLRNVPSVKEAGLLWNAPIGPFPKAQRNGRIAFDLPPGFQARTVALAKTNREAVRACYGVAVQNGVFGEEIEPTLEALGDPATLQAIKAALERHYAPATANTYFNRLKAFLKTQVAGTAA